MVAIFLILAKKRGNRLGYIRKLKAFKKLVRRNFGEVLVQLGRSIKSELIYSSLL